jgi:hypothetical protein
MRRDIFPYLDTSQADSAMLRIFRIHSEIVTLPVMMQSNSSYRNVMELLIEESVDQYLSKRPYRQVAHVNRAELIAYALNQLPPLYATSEKGLTHQLQRGRRDYGERIQQAIHRAMAAISRDPIRNVSPLPLPQQASRMQHILQNLRKLLRNDYIDWDTLPMAVERALNSRGQAVPSHTANRPSHPSDDYPYDIDRSLKGWEHPFYRL